MSQDPRQRLDRIVRQVLSRPAAERESFLADACAGDVELRRRVDFLLASSIGAGSPTDSQEVSPGQDGRGSEPGAWAHSALQTGRRIGVYRLLSVLGRGGMGEVYLAEDTRLGRRVALKLLPEALTGSPERVGRFQREARAASALNHPNILTIHDFGEDDGQQFIASEVVEGRTLREVIVEGVMTAPEAIEVAAQIAGALGAAHEAGIVHRDIKPENVMVRPDGYVKVLDFGLAKLGETPTGSDPGEEEPPSAHGHFETRTGMMMGTVNYMSPEQARSERVDSRTDLFSLGVVLYEMLAGRRPFEGATRSHVLVAILDQQPPPLEIAAAEVHHELRRIVDRALRKERSERYQTAHEMQQDLRRLLQEIDLHAVGGVPRRSRRDARVEPAGREIGGGLEGPGIVERSAAPTWSRRLKRPILAAAAVLVLVASVVSVRFIVSKALARRDESSWSLDRMRITRLSTTANVLVGTISRDGMQVAYSIGQRAGTSLWIKDVATGIARELTPPVEGWFWGLSFAADGKSVYCVREEVVHRVGGTLFQVPAAGGPPRRLLTNIASISASPDGRHLAFKRAQGTPEIEEIVIADPEGRDQRELAVGTEDRRLIGFAWSPDGRSGTLLVHEHDAQGDSWSLIDKPLDGGPERTILSKHRSPISALSWLPDRSGLVITSVDEVSGLGQLWHVAVPGGALTRITHDLNDYGPPVVTADGGEILTVQQSRPDRIWVATLADPRGAKPVTPPSGNYGNLVWMPDGRLVYSMGANREHDLWSMAPDGTDPRQLTRSTGVNTTPAVSPDGRSIVFLSSRTGTRCLWRMDADGGHQVPLTDFEAWAPQISADGRWVYYQREMGKRSAVCRLPLEGGASVTLDERDTATRSAVSPDGRLLAFEYFDAAGGRNRIAVEPLGGGSRLTTFEFEMSYDTVRWTPDGKGLLFLIAGNDHGLLLQPIAGGPARRLVDPGYEDLFDFALSPDGEKIAYTIGVFASDLVLFDGLRRAPGSG